MTTIPRVLFVALLVLCPAVIWGTSGALPERVATHFGHDGLANGWMTRDGYRAFMLALGTLMPLFMVAVAGFAPQFGSRAMKVPNPGYWLAPERKHETLARMRTHACWLGSTMLVFFTGMHFLLLRANAVTPAHLPEGPFYAMIVALVIVVVAWGLALRIVFRTP